MQYQNRNQFRTRLDKVVSSIPRTCSWHSRTMSHVGSTGRDPKTSSENDFSSPDSEELPQGLPPISRMSSLLVDLPETAEPAISPPDPPVYSALTLNNSDTSSNPLRLNVNPQDHMTSFWESLDAEVALKMPSLSPEHADAALRPRKLRKARSSIYPEHRVSTLSTLSLQNLTRFRKLGRSTSTLPRPSKILDLPEGVKQIGGGIGFKYNVPVAAKSKASICTNTPQACHGLFHGRLHGLGLGLLRSPTATAKVKARRTLMSLVIPERRSDERSFPTEFRGSTWSLVVPLLPDGKGLESTGAATASSSPISGADPVTPATLVCDAATVTTEDEEGLDSESVAPQTGSGDVQMTLRLVVPTGAVHTSLLSSSNKSLFAMSDEVVWFQPTYGSTYHPGQQIPVSWRSSQSNCHASFRLCMSNALSAPQGRSEDNGSASRGCGTETWPTVTKQKNGTCTTLLDPPSVRKEQTYTLQMEDESGNKSESPYFSLTASRAMSAPDHVDEKSTNTAPAPSSAHKAGEAAPYQVPKDSFDQEIPSDRIDDQTFLLASFAGPRASPPASRHAGGPSLSARDAASDSAPVPNMLLSSNGPNPIAFAVPLGLVLCIALVAVVLAVRHYRKRVRERTTDAEKLTTLSRFSSRDSTYKAPLEFPANAALSAHVSGPVPLFMPMDLDAPQPAPETKRAPRKSVPISASYTNTTAPEQGTTKPVRGSRPLMVARESIDLQRGGDREKGGSDGCGQSRVVLSDPREKGH
ncbi:hypothetical protein DXG01_009154 [Tephrocybe rancida]|nr:hypothetical protein DXG01_009154 [Tephrocybe rancida]